jgi:RNA polymerase sigma factor (sigma-70 family)
MKTTGGSVAATTLNGPHGATGESSKSIERRNRLLVALYWATIREIVSIRVLDGDARQDAEQEAWLAVFRAVDSQTFSGARSWPNSDLDGFIAGVTWGAVSNFLRCQKRWLSRHDGNVERATNVTVGRVAEASSDCRLHNVEDCIVIDDILTRLSGGERRLLEQRLAGFTNREIAKELGVHESTVSRHLQSAIRHATGFT